MRDRCLAIGCGQMRSEDWAIGDPQPLAIGFRGWRGLGFPRDRSPYSHSIVPGGFEVMSYTTRLTPSTSFTIRFEIVSSNS